MSSKVDPYPQLTYLGVDTSFVCESGKAGYGIVERRMNFYGLSNHVLNLSKVSLCQ